jgi:hypothetical protein
LAVVLVLVLVWAEASHADYVSKVSARLKLEHEAFLV